MKIIDNVLNFLRTPATGSEALRTKLLEVERSIPEAEAEAARLADARDQDLRDTAVTWLARAGCTLPEICQITGHSMQSAQQTLKHYLASHPEIADNAIRKLVEWMDGQA